MGWGEEVNGARRLGGGVGVEGVKQRREAGAEAARDKDGGVEKGFGEDGYGGEFVNVVVVLVWVLEDDDLGGGWDRVGGEGRT